MSSLSGAPVKIRFFPPHPALTPYISTLYLSEIMSPDGAVIADYLHPEWANIRLIQGGSVVAAIGGQERKTMPAMVATGPTSHATYFATSNMRAWGIGILPLGWVKFLGVPANSYADKFVNAATDPSFSKFAPLGKLLDRPETGSEAGDATTEANIINDFLLKLLDGCAEDDAAVQQAHSLIADPEYSTVAGLAEGIGISGRSLERLSCRAFGFPPKLLLRRQRFLRTLARVMLNPDMLWISSLDDHYHDQAHFARDFNRFMGMSASQYKALSHPILGAAIFGRMAAAGAAMQVLHQPD